MAEAAEALFHSYTLDANIKISLRRYVKCTSCHSLITERSPFLCVIKMYYYYYKDIIFGNF